MKQKVLLFTAFIGMCSVVFTSHKSGAGSMGQGNVTGGPGSGGLTCAVAGCHNGGLGTANGGFEVRKRFKPDSNAIVNAYYPDSLYTVRFNMSHSTLHVFGFQMEVLRLADSSNKGVFSNLGSKLHTLDVAGKTLLETIDTIKVAGTSADVYFTWKAPAKNTGMVRFYTSVIAANGDAAATGDVCGSGITYSLAESTVSAEDPLAQVQFKTYPNPVSNRLVIDSKQTPEGKYHVTVSDIYGKHINTSDIQVNNGVFYSEIDMSGMATGIYVVHIAGNQGYHSMTIIKE